MLTEMECNVPSCGLNFAITPKTIPYKKFIVAMEIACSKISNGDPMVSTEKRDSNAKPGHEQVQKGLISLKVGNR